jgi:hypothetical protein
MHRKNRVLLSGLTGHWVGFWIRGFGFSWIGRKNRLSPPEIGVWLSDMENRTSERFGSHGFSRIRWVWLAGRTGLGHSGPPRSAGNQPELHRNRTVSPVFGSGPRYRTPRSTGHGLFPLRLSSTQSLSGSLSPVCISPSSLSSQLTLFLSQFLDGSGEKNRRGRKKEDDEKRKRRK